jgi:hypothetical protein
MINVVLCLQPGAWFVSVIERAFHRSTEHLDVDVAV